MNLSTGPGVSVSPVPGPVGSRYDSADRRRADPNFLILPERTRAHVHARQRFQGRRLWISQSNGRADANHAERKARRDNPRKGATHHVPPLG